MKWLSKLLKRKKRHQGATEALFLARAHTEALACTFHRISQRDLGDTILEIKARLSEIGNDAEVHQ